MKNLKNGCTRTEVYISPKNYKSLKSKEDLKKQWFVECRFFDPSFESKYPKGFGVTTFEWTEKLSPHALPLENEKQKKELQFRI